MVNVVLYLIAAICFGAASFGVSSRVNLIAVGLLSWVLVQLLAAIGIT